MRGISSISVTKKRRKLPSRTELQAYVSNLYSYGPMTIGAGAIHPIGFRTVNLLVKSQLPYQPPNLFQNWLVGVTLQNSS